MSDLPYTYPVRVAELPASGLNVRLEPDAEARARLARHVNIVALHSFVAELKVTPKSGDRAVVTGRISGEIRHVSVVSLEPFDEKIAEEVEARFEPESDAPPKPMVETDEPDLDPPDVIVGGVIDLGVLVTEFLSIGIDPYPRRAGEIFEAPVEDATAASPFSALARLKDKS